MQFLGYADKDLRCVRFRHCWDHTPSFAQVNLVTYDGMIEEKTDYDVITFFKEQIERALMQETDTEYYVKHGHPTKIELIGSGETEVSAWLYYSLEALAF